jgi:hypothetical protein
MQVAEVSSGKKAVNGRNSIENLQLGKIKADFRAQPRENLITDVVQSYAEAMQDGAVFPPLVVFHDGDDYWLADGFHRRVAADSIGLTEFRCEVRNGNLRDAILFSCQVNAAHGSPRTAEDKRRAVMKLLQDDEWSHWSDREIARNARVGHPLVAKLRAELVPPITSAEQYKTTRTFVTKHGTVAKRKVTAKSVAKSAAGTSAATPTRSTTAPASQKGPDVGKVAVCNRVREAITILSGLPPAHEVAEYFAGTDAAIIISERLSPAAAWVAAFSDAWKENQC